ncbi:kxDL motif-containing protein CG10681-like [Ctenocephalides felis]|uniref:kxDL motif-containing protein CG10681-like n=1 Tax=Ctenocephalides felis TaxID=7515 RepID=UPI000E6E191E|nr:kxDL motif-containing protein CG10681-like [Ctenocephalides felis]
MFNSNLIMEQGEITPESEYSIECFQNYTAPEVFIQGLAGLVNQGDVESMIRAQKQMLQRFEKTNEMLINCNSLSAGRLRSAGAEFKKYTQQLVDMKKDLDYIFKKIRVIKTKLSNQYPEAFKEAQKRLTDGILEEDEIACEAQPSTPEVKHRIGTKECSKSENNLATTDKKEMCSKSESKAKPEHKKDDENLHKLSLKNSKDNMNYKRRSLVASNSTSTSSSTDHSSSHSNESSDCSTDTG